MNGTPSSAFGTTGGAWCSTNVATPGVPANISNAAGLPAIEYRIGDFTSFRAAMLAAVPEADLLAGGVTSLQSPVGLTDTAISVVDDGSFPATGPFRIKIDDEYLQVIDCVTPINWTVTRGNPAAAHEVDAFVTLVPLNPFANWRPGIASDYQTMLVELWAYLADILTFYQERIANEALLGTATLRDSLLRLVDLIDYRPSPGAAAEGLAAFTVAANQSVVVPAGFRVANKPQAGQQSVTFETAAPVLAAADNNRIGLSLVSPEIPFETNTVVLQGINPGVSVGSYLVILDCGSGVLVRVTGVAVDSKWRWTTVSWLDTQNAYQQASKKAAVYAFRVKAAPFGYNASIWDVLSPTLTGASGLYSASWEFRAIGPAGNLALNDWYFLPTPLLPAPGVVVSAGVLEPSNQLFLDQEYTDLAYSESNPGLAVLLTDNDVFQILTVIGSRSVARTAYAMAGPSTRLDFEESFTLQTFPFRGTTVLTGNALLPLQVDLPIPDPVTGSLTLAGIHNQLQDGQTVVVSGNVFDPISQSATSAVVAESATLDGPAEPDVVNNVTLVNLKQGLANQYSIASCALLGNIATMTQGQTVADEILGDGDGSAFQTFSLKKSPLTFLPSTYSEGLTAVESTLTVSVNNVAWTEQPDLASSLPNDTVFVTSIDDSGETTVLFGDGFNGACPPTGVQNIHAHYRSGLGSSGNLPAGAVAQLVNGLTNLQSVASPIPTTGGADPDSPSSIRKNAPGSLRTFGRAVSVEDYAALAASYPGIAKASAAWVVSDPSTGMPVPHPYVQLTAASANRVPLQGTTLAVNLRRFLDSRRDPNVSLRIQDFTPVYLAVSVTITINPEYPQQATLNAVTAALNPGINPDGSLGFFAFERLGFGEPVYLSAVYAAVQAVSGVDNAVVTTLSRMSPPADPANAAPHDIFPGPAEVAVIDSTAVAASTLAVSGNGGFAT
jgi:hypothetical protein